MNNTRFAQPRAAFRQLHRQGCFVLPNPWDPGSAKWLAHAGFKALASTSSGYAFSRGHADGGIGLEEMLGHLRELALATDLPVNADFENGHAEDLDELKTNVRRCVETGVAGLSIEDAHADADQPVYPLDVAVARILAVREAIDASGEDVMLIGRADGRFHGFPDLDELIQRLRAYAEAGADCLYAPGLATAEEVRAVVQAVAPKPVNVLLGPATALGVQGLADLGVRRISVGGALALSAWSGFARAATGLAQGRADDFASGVTHADLGQLFGGNQQA